MTQQTQIIEGPKGRDYDALSATGPTAVDATRQVVLSTNRRVSKSGLLVDEIMYPKDVLENLPPGMKKMIERSVCA